MVADHQGDREGPIRREVTERLTPWCECMELAHATSIRGGRCEIDVLVRPRDPALHDFSLAFEVKTPRELQDADLGKWLKQAADYVYSIPINGWPRVAASFVWLVGMTKNPAEKECWSMNGMLILAQHFRVGQARDDHGLELVFGPSAAVFRRKTWTPRAAELLGATRIYGGTRKPLLK